MIAFTLTTLQILEIMNEIENENEKLDVSYQGWANDGIKPYVMDKINLMEMNF